MARPASTRVRWGTPKAADQLIPSLGRPAEPVLAHHVPVVAALAPQVGPGRRRVRSGEQALVVPGDGLLQRLVEPRSALVVAAGGLVVVAQRDAGPGRQLLDGLDEVEMLQLPDEGDDVAFGAAAEAVVEAQLGVDARTTGSSRCGTGTGRPSGTRPGAGPGARTATATKSVAARTLAMSSSTIPTSDLTAPAGLGGADRSAGPQLTVPAAVSRGR